MAPTTRAAQSDAVVAAKAYAALDDVADANAAQSSRPRVPVVLQFPLAVVLSFATASLGYSLVNERSHGELAAVSRSLETREEVALLAGWRIVELALGWFGHADGLDVVSLDILSHGPALYLLHTFYALSPSTAVSALFVDAFAAAVPFYLLRPLAAFNRVSVDTARRERTDLPLQLYTSALATAIYTVTLFLSFRFLLPRVLVLYFAHLPTLEPAYAASYTAALPTTLLLGIAASSFIFVPFAATRKSKEDDQLQHFDPVRATLRETVRWNFWGFTRKTKVIIRRTAAAMLLSGINTYLACTRTIYGVESAGAVIYAGVWVFAALCTGVALDLVGRDYSPV